jgi:hypothetical protein
MRIALDNLVDCVAWISIFEPFADGCFGRVGNAVDVDDLGKVDLAPLEGLEGLSGHIGLLIDILISPSLKGRPGAQNRNQTAGVFPSHKGLVLASHPAIETQSPAMTGNEESMDVKKPLCFRERRPLIEVF